MGRLSQCRTYGMVPETNDGSHRLLPELPPTLPQQKEGYDTAFAIPLDEDRKELLLHGLNDLEISLMRDILQPEPES